MYWVYEVLYAYQRLLNTIVDVTGATALVARNRLKGQYQSAIAPNQWQIEMQNLVSTSLATMQGAFVEAANGQSRPGLKKAMKKPNLNDTGALHLCKSQVRPVSLEHFSFKFIDDTQYPFLTQHLADSIY